MHLEKRSPAMPARARGADIDLAGSTSPDDSDLRTVAQRRLTLKIAAGAGLSLALAAVVVVTALGDGGAT